MKNKKLILIYLCAAFLTTACGSNNTNQNLGTTNTDTPAEVATSVEEIETENAADASKNAVEITDDFEIVSDVVGGVTQDGNTYIITKGGEYKLSGKLTEGTIVVDVSDKEEVTLVLNGVSITSSENSPINVVNADSIKIKSEESTYNEIIDTRSAKEESDEDTDDSSDENAAIYAKCDLSLVGKGSLVVSSTYNNGIQSKKELSIKNVTLKVTAANNAIKGNDSLEIESGEIIAIATGGDGLKTSNSDMSSSGNMRGTLTISGGNIDVYAACDGIDSAYSVDISGDGNLNIYTDSYSDYSGEVQESDDTDFYIVVASDVYSEDNDYYAYYYNDDEDGKWVQATYVSTVSSGRSRYYGLLLTEPSGYSSVAYYIFESGVTPSLDSYIAASDGGSINTSMNAYLISSVSSETITGDWNSLSTSKSSSGSAQEYSTKGIKADSEITISGAVITIYSTDDGIHANNNRLEANAFGLGLVTISGGTITIAAGDDGIHADNTLLVEGGTVNVVESYEGLEASDTLTIAGGTVYAYASDDGLNAGTLIEVTGGYVDVTTPSGDTDAIDSNGNYEQSGGVVLVKGGSSSGSVSGSIDVDGSVIVTGGTVFAMGGICETPEDSVNAYVMSGQSFSAGEYVLKDSDGNEVISFTLENSYTNAWVASELLTTDSDYILTKDGEELLTWTQEDGTMGASSFGGFGQGGNGGFGGNQGGGGFGQGGGRR
jgi:hypothetical protein